MTQEKLKKANSIDSQINSLKSILRDLKGGYKNISLEDDFFSQTTIYFSSNNPHQHCAIFDKKRVEKFIESEIEIIKKELEDLDNEFKNL